MALHSGGAGLVLIGLVIIFHLTSSYNIIPIIPTLSHHAASCHVSVAAVSIDMPLRVDRLSGSTHSVTIVRWLKQQLYAVIRAHWYDTVVLYVAHATIMPYHLRSCFYLFHIGVTKYNSCLPFLVASTNVMAWFSTIDICHSSRISAPVFIFIIASIISIYACC